MHFYLAHVYTLMNDECEKRIERRRVLLEKKNDRGAFSFAFQLQLWHAVKRILYSMILSCTVNIIMNCVHNKASAVQINQTLARSLGAEIEVSAALCRVI
jgi:hypothetical protein